MKIRGSVALVTGANRGLGEAIVWALLAAGAAKIYAAARDQKKLPAFGPRVVPITLDITSHEQIAAAARNANDVTLLVNNAGILTSYNVLTASDAALLADFQTNVLGTLAVIRAFVRVLAEAPAGATIVNVSSLSALASVPSMGGYAASKAAAYSITQALRPDVRSQRIQLVAALAGPIDTDMVRSLELPKTSAAEVASALLAGVERDEEEIFPDPLAQQMAQVWNKSPKELERAFSGY